MAKEIERKFLVTKNPWTTTTGYVDIMQGYLNNDGHVIVRVRWQTMPDMNTSTKFQAAKLQRF
jgi:CYTH domain-containing protein